MQDQDDPHVDAHSGLATPPEPLDGLIVGGVVIGVDVEVVPVLVLGISAIPVGVKLLVVPGASLEAVVVVVVC